MSTVLGLNGLYMTAESLCGAFVGVYLYVNSLDIATVCLHYIAVYGFTAFVFVLAGWVAKKYDRMHVFRIGLVLQAAYYAFLLYLGPSAAEFPVILGVLLGIAWGLFWQGNNVLAFDVTSASSRDYFFGLLGIVFSAARLVSPIVSGLIISFAPGTQGYQIIFAISVVLYTIGVAYSFGVAPDRGGRPYLFWRAMFPPPERRDWRLMLLSAFSLAGAFNILPILMALLMFIETESELNVGGFAGLQALCAMLVSWLLGWWLVPGRRRGMMRLGVALLCFAGTLVLIELNSYTLIVFGVLFAASMQFFNIPYTAIAYDVMWQNLDVPEERIEYLSAWEVPLGIGRMLMLALVVVFAYLLPQDALGLRIMLFVLCATRLITYYLVMQTSVMRAMHPQQGTASGATPASKPS